MPTVFAATTLHLERLLAARGAQQVAVFVCSDKSDVQAAHDEQVAAPHACVPVGDKECSRRGFGVRVVPPSEFAADEECDECRHENDAEDREAGAGGGLEHHSSERADHPDELEERFKSGERSPRAAAGASRWRMLSKPCRPMVAVSAIREDGDGDACGDGMDSCAERYECGRGERDMVSSGSSRRMR